MWSDSGYVKLLMNACQRPLAGAAMQIAVVAETWLTQTLDSPQPYKGLFSCKPSPYTTTTFSTTKTRMPSHFSWTKTAASSASPLKMRSLASTLGRFDDHRQGVTPQKYQ
jgi:hypothetical protein